MAQPVEEAANRASVKTVAAAIENELQGHGERVMGKELIHWTTRLEKVEDCRAEFTVRTANNLGDSTVRRGERQLLAGRAGPVRDRIRSTGCNCPAPNRTSASSRPRPAARNRPDGVVTDCGTASQKRADSFALQFDGDAESAQRLEAAFREAVESCRQPSLVTF